MGFPFGLCSCFETRGRSTGDGEGETADDGGEFFFEPRELQIATNYFSEWNLIGIGRFGPVYKGLMPNGQAVAVKKLSFNSDQGLIRTFSYEVRLLFKVQHKNLVTLLGCCLKGPEKMLICEYIPNKSLDYILFKKKKFPSLDWTKRFRIVTGVARGLPYLHEEGCIRILHRDIKAGNIFLDEQLNPKISNFGMARLLPRRDIDMDVLDRCAIGYMAPEYLMHGYLSVKTDVFSFGVLVLEIVSGRKNYNQQLGEEKADLLSYTWMLFEEGRSLDLVDPSLDDCNFNEAAMCIQLGLLCCQKSAVERPNMISIHRMLSSDSFTLPRPGRTFVDGHSDNCISPSSIDEGR